MKYIGGELVNYLWCTEALRVKTQQHFRKHNVLHDTAFKKTHNISWKIKTKRKCNISHFKKFCCGLLNVVVLLKLSLHFPENVVFCEILCVKFCCILTLGATIPTYIHMTVINILENVTFRISWRFVVVY